MNKYGNSKDLILIFCVGVFMFYAIVGSIFISKIIIWGLVATTLTFYLLSILIPVLYSGKTVDIKIVVFSAVTIANIVFIAFILLIKDEVLHMIELSGVSYYIAGVPFIASVVCALVYYYVVEPLIVKYSRSKKVK